MFTVMVMDDTLSVADGRFANQGTTSTKIKVHIFDAVDEARKAAWKGNGTWKALRREPMKEFHVGNNVDGQQDSFAAFHVRALNAKS